MLLSGANLRFQGLTPRSPEPRGWPLCQHVLRDDRHGNSRSDRCQRRPADGVRYERRRRGRFGRYSDGVARRRVAPAWRFRRSISTCGTPPIAARTIPGTTLPMLPPPKRRGTAPASELSRPPVAARMSIKACNSGSRPGFRVRGLLSDTYQTYRPSHGQCRYPCQLGPAWHAIGQRRSASYRRTRLFNNTYDMPGGAYGSLITDKFSLASMSATDKPTFYFDYFLDTEDANHAIQGTRVMRDSARVYIGPFTRTDTGGSIYTTWDLLATNNDVPDSPGSSNSSTARCPRSSRPRSRLFPTTRGSKCSSCTTTRAWRQVTRRSVALRGPDQSAAPLRFLHGRPNAYQQGQFAYRRRRRRVSATTGHGGARIPV